MHVIGGILVYLKTKNSLQISQNKIIRFVLGLGPRTRIDFQKISEVKWLLIEQRVQQMILNHAFRVKNDLAPDYFAKYFFLGE